MDKLRALLAEDDTILFVGSGISNWSGLPTWLGLIADLADFLDSLGIDSSLVRAEMKAGDLLQAASYAFDRLTKPQIASFMRTSCKVETATPHDIHKKILALGPLIYITTNYDSLLENALQLWYPDRQKPLVVTNRNLVELAEIVHTRATNFIYKPHGDIRDSESIILSREQYRNLLPQGEYAAALETLRTLMATRPVLYVGFGLRDPDFLYIRNILLNLYKGAPRDHFAIMPDIVSEEREYWRRHYGIHLISYSTDLASNGVRDHTPLLHLLDSLHAGTPARRETAPVRFHSATAILALARHAARFTRFTLASPEYQIRVYKDHESGPYPFGSVEIGEFDHSPIGSFLLNGPRHAVVVGLPGSGKTYALQKASAVLGEQLQERCLELEPLKSRATVPLYIDLKLYAGNIKMMVNEGFPSSLPFDYIAKHCDVKLFFDSFNEMPSEYRESGSYDKDFAGFVEEYSHVSILIGSRTSDGLRELGYPVYSLDLIDEDDVKAGLKKHSIAISGPFASDILYLLRRPFYFRQVLTNLVSLPSEAHPTDFHRQFFVNLGKEFQDRFKTRADIGRALAEAAYVSLDHGEEAFPLSYVVQSIQMLEGLEGASHKIVNDLINWLIYKEVLVPYSGSRVAFVHQAITEHLASDELARRYVSSTGLVREKLRNRRWDQALLQAVSYLPKKLTESFLDEVVDVDLGLALRAAKYMEFDREAVISRLLGEVVSVVELTSSWDFDVTSNIASAIQDGLPVSSAHREQLKGLARRGESIGASAAIRLMDLEGDKAKEEMLQLMVDRPDDYNLCGNGIGPALRPFALVEDVERIAKVADGLNCSTGDRIEGFVQGSAEMLVGMDVEVIRRAMVPADTTEELSRGRGLVLCALLREHKTNEALKLAGELLTRGVKDAGITIYFIANFSKEDLGSAWSSYGSAHVQVLMAYVLNGDGWSMRALRILCNARADLVEMVEQAAERQGGIERAALLYGASTEYVRALFSGLEKLTDMDSDSRSLQPLDLLHDMEFEWSGREKLFVTLLRLRDVNMAKALFGGRFPPNIEGLGKLDIGPIDWWLDWMLQEESETGDWQFLEGLSGLFGSYLDRNKQSEFVAEFNRPDSRCRRTLMRLILPHFSEFTTDAFSEDAVAYILEDLNSSRMTSSLRGHVIGALATEEFISIHLLPQLKIAEGPRLENMQRILRQAGARLGVRFLV